MELAAHRGDHPIGLPPNGSPEISPARPKVNSVRAKVLPAAKRLYAALAAYGSSPESLQRLNTGGHLWTGIPLWNSLRIAAISTVIIFFAGIFAAYYIAKLPRLIKGVLDVVLTLPLVLPPTVVGYLLLRVLGPKRVIGAWVLETFGVKLVMTWWSAIFATTVVIFPLMYRTVRGAFEAFDETLAYSGQTLGLSNTYIFWRIRMPCCRQGVLAGHGTRLRPRARRIRRDQHDRGLHARQDGDHLHHRLSALADEQRRAGLPVGRREHRDLRHRAAGGQYA